MKKALFISMFLISCSASKTPMFHVTKPTDEREWRALRWADSAVCKIMGFDSTTYDWQKKIQYDWKDGKAVTHKFKN